MFTCTIQVSENSVKIYCCVCLPILNEKRPYIFCIVEIQAFILSFALSLSLVPCSHFASSERKMIEQCQWVQIMHEWVSPYRTTSVSYTFALSESLADVCECYFVCVVFNFTLCMRRVKLRTDIHKVTEYFFSYTNLGVYICIWLYLIIFIVSWK